MVNLLEFLQSHEEAFKSRNRLASLYSSFHTQRAINPEGYAANSSAWLSALHALSRAGLLPPPATTTASTSSSSTATSGSALTFASSPALSRALSTPQFGQPLALNAVLADAIQKGDLIPLRHFLTAERSIYYKPWLALPSPVQVVTWGLAALGLTGSNSSGERLVAGDFVVRANVEAAATAVVEGLTVRGQGLTERIVPRAEFEREFAGALAEGQDGAAKLGGADFEVLLRYLSRDRPVLRYSGNTVKIAVSGLELEDVTKQDESIANLKELIGNMGAQVESLHDRVTMLDKEARRFVVEKQASRAKMALRQRKAAEVTLEQRSKTLDTLEHTWRSIEAAADNVAIVKAMKESGEVLKGLNAAVGGAEGVDEVMEGLQEQMDVTQDVTQIINEGAKMEGVDEGEIDDELEALEKVERERSEQVERTELERREQEEAERTKQRLAGMDVPMSDPGQNEDEEERFEEASETTT